MAEYVTAQSPQLVGAGQNVLLIDSVPCRRGLVLHRNGSGILTLRGPSCGCAKDIGYQVSFTGNIAIPTGGTAGAIAIALTIDGEPVQTSRAIVTPTVVGAYFNVTSNANIVVPRGCCVTIAVENVAAGVDAVVAQQAINVADGNLTVNRVA